MISYTPSSPNPSSLYSPPSNYNTSYLSYPSYYSPPTPPTSPPPHSPQMPTRSNHYANSSTITINKLMITTNNNLNTSNNNLNYEHYENYENYDNIPNPHSPLPSNTPPPPSASASPSPSPSPSPTPQHKHAKPLHSTTIYINNHEYTCSGGQENQQKILMAFKETSKPSSVPGPLLMLDESRQEVDALIAKEYSSYVQMRTISTSIVNEVRSLLGKGISCPMSLVCTLREQLQLLKEALEVLCYTEEKKVSFSHQLVQDAVERWYMSGTRGKRKIEECEELPQKQSNGQAQTQSPESSSSNSSPNSTTSSSSSATPPTESSVPQHAKKKKRTSKQIANTKLDESSHADSTTTSRATLKRDRDSSKLMSINNIIN